MTILMIILIGILCFFAGVFVDRWSANRVINAQEEFIKTLVEKSDNNQLKMEYIKYASRK